jgi:hypothetical protein
MAKRVKGRGGRGNVGQSTLEQKVREAVVYVWGQIQGDVGEGATLEEAAELCLDAHRPVTFGALSHQDYNAMEAEDAALVDRWAMEALAPYFSQE